MKRGRLPQFPLTQLRLSRRSPLTRKPSSPGKDPVIHVDGRVEARP